MNIRKISSLLFAGVLCLSPIGVKAAQMYATSEDGSKSYTSIDSAWSAAQGGTKIIMNCDWDISSRLVLDSGKTATIEMNGHKISRGLSSSKTNGEVIKLSSKSTLNLTGKLASQTTFNFLGYENGLHKHEVSTTSGGLITGGYSTNGAGGIHMKAGSTLNLDSVSISGNAADESWGSDGQGAAIYMDGNGDNITMKNAIISYNAAEIDGGGIYVQSESANIKMDENSKIIENTAGENIVGLDDDEASGGGIAINKDNVTITLSNGSTISDNYANAYGGGIYSNGKYTTIRLNNSSINSNSSDNNGGGIYFNYSDFEVQSDNKDGSISYNKALTDDWGGGIYAARCYFSSNEGKINGITFTGNTSHIGGALNIHQEYVTVSNCTFKENCAEISAAIAVENDNFVLENSIVQNNFSNNDFTGAINVDSYNDITLRGDITITNNANKQLGCDTDLYLTSTPATKARILSAPSSTSKIGLFVTDEFTVAKNQTSDARNIYYVNNPNEYTIAYDESSNELVSKATSGDGASSDWEASKQSQENQDEQTATTQEDTQTYTITINMVNEAGTWQKTEKTTISSNEAFELQAPIVEDKEFVEFKDIPESLTVENDLVKADSISEDVELTLVYSDEESESTEAGSIFGDGNTMIAGVVIVGILAIGLFTFFMKKKKSS